MRWATHMTRSIAAFALVFVAVPAYADTGTPPADVGAAVAAPKATAAPDAAKASKDTLLAAINAGAQIATGNSRLVAITGGGKIDARVGKEGLGAAVIGNYSTSYDKATNRWKDSVRNFQARARYERYLTTSFSLFVQLTGLYDPFQGVSFRFNVDPGVKYLFLDKPKAKIWGELGYDFEYDLNYTDKNGIELDPAVGGQFLVDAAGLPYVVNTDMTMHSARAFAGFQYAFNKEVVFTTGLEFLQGVGGSGDGYANVPPGYTDAQVDRVKLNLTRTRINFDALLTANLGAGFAVGAGFSLKWNSAPLPGKENLDTMSTFTLIYSLNRPDPNKKPEAPPVAPPPVAPPPPATTTPPPPADTAPVTESPTPPT